MQRETKTVSSWTRCKTDKSEIFKHHLWSLIRWIFIHNGVASGMTEREMNERVESGRKKWFTDFLLCFRFRSSGQFLGWWFAFWWNDFEEVKGEGEMVQLPWNESTRKRRKKIGCWADTNESCLMLTRICPVASYRSHQTTHMNTFSLPSPLTSRMS